jgi:hypothetical protein
VAVVISVVGITRVVLQVQDSGSLQLSSPRAHAKQGCRDLVFCLKARDCPGKIIRRQASSQPVCRSVATDRPTDRLIGPSSVGRSVSQSASEYQ